MHSSIPRRGVASDGLADGPHTGGGPHLDNSAAVTTPGGQANDRQCPLRSSDSPGAARNEPRKRSQSRTADSGNLRGGQSHANSGSEQGGIRTNAPIDARIRSRARYKEP